LLGVVAGLPDRHVRERGLQAALGALIVGLAIAFTVAFSVEWIRKRRATERPEA
jgi:hypothetical protein